MDVDEAGSHHHSGAVDRLGSPESRAGRPEIADLSAAQAHVGALRRRTSTVDDGAARQ